MTAAARWMRAVQPGATVEMSDKQTRLMMVWIAPDWARACLPGRSDADRVCHTFKENKKFGVAIDAELEPPPLAGMSNRQTGVIAPAHAATLFAAF